MDYNQIAEGVANLGFAVAIAIFLTMQNNRFINRLMDESHAERERVRIEAREASEEWRREMSMVRSELTQQTVILALLLQSHNIDPEKILTSRVNHLHPSDGGPGQVAPPSSTLVVKTTG